MVFRKVRWQWWIRVGQLQADHGSHKHRALEYDQGGGRVGTHKKPGDGGIFSSYCLR